MRISKRTIFVFIIIAAVLAVAAYSAFLVGTPGYQRSLQFDERRVSDLQNISFAVQQYWDRTGQLPASLAEFSKFPALYYINSTTDPKTQQSYEYNISGERSYELCAVFENVSQNRVNVPKYYQEEQWKHEAGRQCFQREVQQTVTPR